jgi:hypothetical protein
MADIVGQKRPAPALLFWFNLLDEISEAVATIRKAFWLMFKVYLYSFKMFY